MRHTCKTKVTGLKPPLNFAVHAMDEWLSKTHFDLLATKTHKTHTDCPLHALSAQIQLSMALAAYVLF